MNTILKTHTPVTQEKNLGKSKTRYLLTYWTIVGVLAVSWNSVIPVNADFFYCVHDDGLNDSQFCHGEPLHLETLGPLYDNCDIEALDISHVTNDLYAAAGDDTPRKSHLYYVHKNNGDVVDLGNIGGPGFLEEVDALSFHPVTDELWGWAQGEGLFVISALPAFPEPAIQPIVDINKSHCLKPIEEITIPAELIISFTNEVEDMTWNWTGDVLYAVENMHTDNPDKGIDNNGIKLWAYDEINGTKILCTNLTPSIAEYLGNSAEIEGLEALPNDFMNPPITADEDLLIATFHGQHKMYYAMITIYPTLSTSQCDIWIDRVEVPFNDIEGIAYIDIEEIAYLPEELSACPSVVGEWMVTLDWNCDDVDDLTLPMAIHEESTWQFDSWVNGGAWIQNNCDLEMTDNAMNIPVIWTGTLEGDGNKLSGTYSNGGGFKGCWGAKTRIVPI
ncbi:hypothetical protein QUF54_00740 [Candidatus Marithioploca araucensis]|uniref:Uncharacterized protein n=1 Tax=Candidatus Marithioploca araucensis TaxID=70273 RepID=A0ABT7VQC0_9GAMM|nr:hypothetical protein [Candidatus Marithioploca araucensis]